MQINTVTVIGANGTMGCNVAAIFASFGNAKVYMVSRSMKKSEMAVQRAVSSVRADSIAGNLIPADYSMLPQCVAESQLIFESVAEDFNVKMEIAALISEHVRDHTIIGTGTSGLSIEQLAKAYPEHLRSGFFGIHMFNPPYNLSLCELISTPHADPDTLAALKAYLSDTLHRTVVEVKDSPAFLGNRIGFQFMNCALQYAEKYKFNGGIDYIDAILGAFSGRSMPPLVTVDFVGLDVHKAIVDNVYQNAPDYERDTFVLPGYVSRLIDQGKLGRKAKGGLYKQTVISNGVRRMMVYDIASDTYRDRIDYQFPFALQMKEAIRMGDYQKAFSTLINNRSVEADICLEFLLRYIVYALHTVRNVGFHVHAADDVMATGFNWCPPLAMADAIGSVEEISKLVSERLDPAMLSEADWALLAETLAPSKYDYRPYFKSI